MIVDGEAQATDTRFAAHFAGFDRNAWVQASHGVTTIIIASVCGLFGSWAVPDALISPQESHARQTCRTIRSGPA